ncbi:MAG: aminopeptidase P family protein [Candidatus Rokubacteria bacterium]|nr:aminopeptidase P family protein [Candidatus Rokubacteria bacterium]
MYFPQAEYEGRWRRVYEVMKARGYETAVVWGRSAGTYERCGDVLYLTNFYSTLSGQGLDRSAAFSAVILEGGQVPELHVGEPDTPRDLLAVERVEWDFDPMRSVAQALNRRKIEGPVALVGSDFLPVKYARRLEQYVPSISWVAEDDLVQSVRRIKSRRELDCYRRAGVTVTAGLNALLEGLVQGRTEAEAAAAAASEVIRRGGNFHMIPCSHGDRIQYWCRYPLTGYSQEAPKPGDLVRGWVYGPMYEGYWLDPGRTAVAGGRPTREQRELIEQTIRIVERLVEAIRPGLSVLDLARLGERLTEEAGGERDQAARMFPLYGHGVGLFFEWPYLSTHPMFPLKVETFAQDMVLGGEAFLARSGVGSAGFEQNIIVRDDGNELLTTTPTIWW